MLAWERQVAEARAVLERRHAMGVAARAKFVHEHTLQARQALPETSAESPESTVEPCCFCDLDLKCYKNIVLKTIYETAWHTI